MFSELRGLRLIAGRPTDDDPNLGGVCRSRVAGRTSRHTSRDWLNQLCLVPAGCGVKLPWPAILAGGGALGPCACGCRGARRNAPVILPAPGTVPDPADASSTHSVAVATSRPISTAP